MTLDLALSAMLGFLGLQMRLRMTLWILKIVHVGTLAAAKVLFSVESGWTRCATLLQMACSCFSLISLVMSMESPLPFSGFLLAFLPTRL